MAEPATLQRSISPPAIRRPSRPTSNSPIAAAAVSNEDCPDPDPLGPAAPTLAAIEAGEARIRDHLAYFATHLEAARRPRPVGFDYPRLSIAGWRDLYLRNQHPRGRHFVVHQHDHPVSGVHYDLRLQFSENSSISFAIPYGLPGNAVSLRPMRMAIETRVHCLWNHLIESASHATGSLLIWDTGEYEVLQPHVVKTKEPDTDDEISSPSDRFPSDTVKPELSDSEKLDQAFRRRHIRLRLHGARLPKGYTISLRLPSANDTDGTTPKKPRYKRRKHATPKPRPVAETETTDTETESATQSEASGGKRKTQNQAGIEAGEARNIAAASGDEEEDELIRATNAYPGANNTIGSVHQRRWFLSLDKQNSGFTKSPKTGQWHPTMATKESEDDSTSGWDAFYVRGRDHERSVVTGRLATEVMEDEGVKMYKGRKMWQPIME